MSGGLRSCIPTEPCRILILRTGSLGDIVHAVPAVWALRRSFPAARIDWVVEGQFAPVLRGHAALDDLVELPTAPGRGAAVRRVLETVAVRQLRTRRYDIAVDLQGLFRTALWSRLSAAAWCVGPDDWREAAPLWYSRTLSRGRAAHVGDQWLTMVRQLGADGGPQEFHLRPEEIHVREGLQSLRGAEAEVLGAQAWAVVFPRTAATRKNWPMEQWAKLAEWLVAERGVSVLVAGGRADEAICEALAERVRRRSGRAVCAAACGLPLERLRVLLAGAALVMGGDSGPLHWAAAMDTPVVALFGPTDPGRSRPRGGGPIEVLRRESGCRACRVALTRRGETWPWGPAHTCLAAVEHHEVQAAVDRVLAMRSERLE